MQLDNPVIYFVKLHASSHCNSGCIKLLDFEGGGEESIKYLEGQQTTAKHLESGFGIDILTHSNHSSRVNR